MKNGFVTKDLYVRSSLKEYNEYRRFLENEFMKVRMYVCMMYLRMYICTIHVYMYIRYRTKKSLHEEK